jgi:biofilm PGA synthesis N-glycosyltransferase PgaC
MIYVVSSIVVLILYHYLMLPIILYIVSLFFTRNYVKAYNNSITVSFIVAALNEEKILHQKIKNCLEMDYPAEKMQFIFVLDGSTDRSYEIVKSYEHLGLICLYDRQRRGKTAAINRAVEIAVGEVVIFSDANSMFDKKAIQYLLQNFSDESIGGVCGRKGIVPNSDRAASRGDSFYWDIESVIKMLQSKIGSISTGDGEIFAIRRRLYHKLPEIIINDDTAITFDLINDGYRVVYEPSAITYEEASLTLKDDFNVKVRMVAGGYQSLQIYGKLLFPKVPLFCLQFISHKVLRWLMPVLLILLLISNMFLLEYRIYQCLFLLQLLFYLAALMGYLYKFRILYFPLYYVAMNLAALAGLYKFARGDMGTKIWKKAER